MATKKPATKSQMPVESESVVEERSVDTGPVSTDGQTVESSASPSSATDGAASSAVVGGPSFRFVGWFKEPVRGKRVVVKGVVTDGRVSLLDTPDPDGDGLNGAWEHLRLTALRYLYAPAADGKE